MSSFIDLNHESPKSTSDGSDTCRQHLIVE